MHFLMNFFSIKKEELCQVILMSLLIFLIFFNQNITRGLKDSLILTLVGAEIISFVKIFIEIPAGIIFALIYTKLSNHISTESIFRIIVLSFIIYFAFFAIYLFPNYKKLQNFNISCLDQFKWITMLYKNWVIVTFYVTAEMWPIIICLFFWQLANKITSSNEAIRFYPIWSMFGQTSLIISGFILNYFAQIFSNIDDKINQIDLLNDNLLLKLLNKFKILDFQDNNILSLQFLVYILILIVFCTGIIIILLQYYITLRKYNIRYDKEKKFTLSIMQSIKIIFKSRYLMLIAIVCMSYHICVNLIESVWFFQAKRYYDNTQSFMQYQGLVLFYTGIFTLFISIFSGSIIRRFGWLFSASVTPVALLFSGSIFFLIVLFDYIITIFDLNNLFFIKNELIYYIIILGAAQNIIGRGAKYSLYDSTKEMLYLSLPNEIKTKGKIAVDIVGVKVGRFLGVMLQTTLFSIFPLATYSSISIYLFIAYVASCLMWILALRQLSSLKSF